MPIEAEVRSFVSQDQFNKLIEFFQENATFLKEDEQETVYFSGEEDIRIQRNKYNSKIILKKGKVHDDYREEIEIESKQEDFEKLEKMFLLLGFNVEIKWFRKRLMYDWNNITVCLDYTKGYGYIIELEQLCTETEQKTVAKLLNKKLASLNIAITPKDEFKNKYEHYKNNWKTLTK